MTKARTIAVRDQVEAALRDEFPLPISTKALCERLGVGRYDATGLVVYRVLAWMWRRGRVECLRFEGMPDAYWRVWSQ